MKRPYYTILVIFLLSFSLVEARFIQADQNIPNIYNPQDLNRYAYARNNPYKYIDPTGEEPTLSQLGSVESVVNFIQNIEQGNPNLSPRDVLSATAAQFKSPSNINSVQARGDFKLNTRFIYTKNKGFIDLGHFFRNAKNPSYGVAIGGGIALELTQFSGITKPLGFGNQLSSGLSYEDLPSNVLGVQFGRNLVSDTPLSQQFSNFVNNIGGSNNPFQDIPTDILATIPQNEQSQTRLSASKLQLNPFGAALPVTGKGLFTKLKQFFIRGSK